MAKMTLEELVSQLRAAYGDDLLRAVVLYGSAAGGEHHAKHSDYNVVVLVSDLPERVIAAAGAVLRAWQEAGNPPPLTMTEAEWRSSVDVFAMEHADMQERNKVLHAAAGYAPFAGRLVTRAHVRHQLEYEAMATLLRVRSGMFAVGSDATKRIALLSGSLSQVSVLFRALLRLAGGTPPTDSAALCRAAATLGGFSADPFVAVVEHRRGSTKLDGAGAARTLVGYHAGLEQLVAYLDALPDEA